MLDIKDFNLPQDLPKYMEAVREFRETYLEEKALEIEELDDLPPDLQPTMKKAGLLDLRVPKDVGGLGLSFSQYWPILVEAGLPHGTIRQNDVIATGLPEEFFVGILPLFEGSAPNDIRNIVQQVDPVHFSVCGHGGLCGPRGSGIEIEMVNRRLKPGWVAPGHQCGP